MGARSPDEPRACVGHSGRVDGMTVLVRHQHRKGLVFAVLRHLVRCDPGQDLLRMTSRLLRARKDRALFVAKRLAVMDIEEVARHRALRAVGGSTQGLTGAEGRGKGRDALRYRRYAYQEFNKWV